MLQEHHDAPQSRRLLCVGKTEGRMSAADELRRMLDERGVEWTKPKRIWWELIDCEPDDSVTIVEGVTIEAATDGMLVVYPLTPEQAIEATLGRGTCHIAVQDNLAETDGMGDVWLECDACNWQMPLEPSTPRFNYCPNCGREVVDE